MLKHLIAFLLFFSPLPAFSQEAEVPITARSDLHIAIYNHNLALVKDKRKVSLKQGDNKIAFSGVSALIRPETALVRGQGFSVLEQNFNFDLLDYNSLLNKSIGAKVKLIDVNPGNGDTVVEYGEVLSNAHGSVVLKVGDRIETNYPGRIVFLDIPKTLRSKPTLVIDVVSTATAAQDIDLSYLTGGFSWKADYTAELDNAEKELKVSGLVTLTNTSGVDYKGALMQLVAGNVNQVSSGFAVMKAAPMMAMREMAMDNAAYAGGVVQEAFMDFHLYTVPRRVDIEDNQTKQISFISGLAQVSKEYIYDSPFNIYSGGIDNSFEKRNPDVKLKFKNDETQGLGAPLPAGIFRVYKSDSQGRTLFAGEDNIRHTPKGEEVKIKLGQAFDVTTSGKRKSFTQLGNKSYEASFELTVKNAKAEDIVVDVYQDFPNNYRILSESVEHEEKSSNRLLWQVPVPREGEAVFNFSVRVTNN